MFIPAPSVLCIQSPWPRAYHEACVSRSLILGDRGLLIDAGAQAVRARFSSPVAREGSAATADRVRRVGCAPLSDTPTADLRTSSQRLSNVPRSYPPPAHRGGYERQ